MTYKNILKCLAYLIVVLFCCFLFSQLCIAAQATGSSVVINEIVARDAGGGNDWIELYVIGSDPVYLGDYSLTDDSAGRVPAPLPDIFLSPGEFIVIEATDEDPNDGAYYVPFKLGADDCVTLYLDTNAVDVLDWADGDAPIGYSYGLLPDGSDNAQILVPTPNAPNDAPAAASSLVINEILARDPSGGNDWIELFVIGSDPVYLGDYSLTDDSAGRVPAPLPGIFLGPGEFIVIEATDEDPNDGFYYVPFKLGADDCVTLYLGSNPVDVLDWLDGEAPSGVSYGLLPDGTGDPQSMTPTPGTANQMFNLFQTDKVVEVRLELTDEDWQAILADPMAEEYKPCNIIYNGIRLDNVAVRTKGYSSLMSVAMDPDSDRYSFKVDINYYVSQDLSGLQKINLNNGFADPTFMREYLSYELMRYMGIPTPRNCFINLYINDELFGLYLAVEAVDDEFVETGFEQGDGDLYKAEMSSDLLWRGDSIANYPSLELKTNEDTSDHSALLTMLDELNNGSDYESVIDVDEVLRYLAVSTVLTNLDSYQGTFAQNYYLYEENGVFSVIPWDFNMSFGGFNMGCGRTSIIEFMIDEPTMDALSARPLIAKLLQDPYYLDIYHGYIDQLITGPFVPAVMDQVIDETANLIRPYVYADPTKFFTVQEFEQGLIEDISSDPNATLIAGFNRGFSLVVGLKTFVHERVASIANQLNGLAPASGDGSGNCPFGSQPGPGWLEPIASVFPSYATQGDTNVLVTVTLLDDIASFPLEVIPLSVNIGPLVGTNISRSGLEITAIFDFPVNGPVGMQPVSVEFPPPDFTDITDPGGQPPPGGWLDPNGQQPPPGGFFPPGGWFDPNGQQPPPGGFTPPSGWLDPNGQPDPGSWFDPNISIILTKSDAFEIRASGVLPPEQTQSTIEAVSPSQAAQGDTNVGVTITLSQDMAMLPPNIIPVSVKIGQLDGSNIGRSGVEVTAVFDIPVNEPAGIRAVSVTLPPPPMDPNAQPMIITRTGAFEIVRGYVPFTIGSTTPDEIVTDIPVIPPGGLYDESILRTIYLEFDQNDWWAQLERNYNIEENILADLTMEGITYHDVGVRFRGMTSYMMTGNSQKKSFNISIDETYPDQRLMGYKTLNLNNASQDPSFIREALYFDIFRRYAPCPQANFVKLVINGENWGIYVNVQQHNADLIEEWFKSSDGDRWKVGMGNFQNGGNWMINDPNMQEFLFNRWLGTNDAQDLNNDGQITQEDYDIFISSQPQPPGGWWGGNRDPLADWLASPSAQDLNNDGQITEEDYNIFLNSRPQPPGGGMFGGWIADPNMVPPGGGMFGGWIADPNMVPPGGGMFGGWIADPNMAWWIIDPNAPPGDPNVPAGGWWGDPNMPPGGGMGGGMFVGGGNGALTWLGEEVAQYEQSYELKSANTPDPWANLINTCYVLNNTPSDQLAEIADDVLAVDRWLWFLAMEIIFSDEDSYLTKGADYQLYYDPKTGQLHPLQHDGNETFNVFFVNRSPFEGEDYPSRPVINKLLAVPAFRERYLEHIRTIIAESLDWSALAPQIEAYRELIADEVIADNKKLYSNSQFEQGFKDIENFVNGRRDYLLSLPEVNRPVPVISSVVRQVAQAGTDTVLPGQPAWIIAFIEAGVNVGQAVLHYTADNGPFEHVSMFFADVPGSAYTGEILAAEIPAYPAGSIVRYYVEVLTADPGESNSFAPYNAENYIYTYKVYSPSYAGSPLIVINELMASNQTTIQDPQGDYDDWIELLNIGPLEVDLSGMYLSDREDNPLKWKIPAGTMLAPGEYLIIWADEDGGDEPGLHANFKLSASGESVLLSDTDERGNTVIDSLVFGEQEADVSFGRAPDGTGQFHILSGPTPNAYNLPSVLDIDADGYTPGEGDCADDNPAINPAALEECDGVDNDCDGLIDEGFDNDSDGYATCAGDCADDNPAIHPWAIEFFDGADNDCDGLVDEEGREIGTVSPSYAVQGDKTVLVTITLAQHMQMLPADISLFSVEIGTLEGRNINRNGLQINAVFDIPVKEPVGMKDVFVVFWLPDGQQTQGGQSPSAQHMVFAKYKAFEIRARSSEDQGGPGIDYLYNTPQTWYTLQNWYIMQSQLKFAQQIPFAPQVGYSRSPQNWYDVLQQGGYRLSLQNWQGVSMLNLYSASVQDWSGVLPQNWYGVLLQGGYGLLPHNWYGATTQALYNVLPRDWYAVPMQGLYLSLHDITGQSFSNIGLKNLILPQSGYGYNLQGRFLP